jgi:ribonuclease-3
MRSAMVNQSSLATLARKLDLGNYMIVGKGEKENGGIERASTLSDLFEALLGAMYMDSDLDTVRAFVLRLVKEEFPEPEKLLIDLNPKGILQEYSQKEWNEPPEYTILSVSGPDHAPSFNVEVKVGEHSARGSASNRKQAEIEAAKNAIMIISENDSDFFE